MRIWLAVLACVLICGFDRGGDVSGTFDDHAPQAAPPPLFYAPFQSGISQLPAAITINGQTVQPSLRCEGKDATAASWACTGGTLTIAGTGTAPTTGKPAPFIDDSQSVLLAASPGLRYESSDSSVADVTTGDIVVEAVSRMSVTGGTLLGKLAADGYQVAIASTRFRLLIDDAVAQVSVSSNVLTDGVWFHAMCFANRDEASTYGAQCYINGQLSGTGADISSASGSLSNSIGLAINSNGEGDAIGAYASNLSFISLWSAPNLFSAGVVGAAEMSDLAAERFNRLTGIVDLAGAPVNQSRASTATLAITDSTCTSTTLFTVGSNWPRVECVCDKYGESICNLYVEPQATNLALYSDAADDAAWATTAVVTADAATDPFGGTDADHIVATADSHLQSAAVTSGAAYTCSVDLKAASAMLVPVQCDDTTVSCSVGTSWTRCSTSDASASSTSISVGLGTGTFEVDWFRYQAEAGAVATSGIKTTSTTVVRETDAVRYEFVAPETGTIRFRLLVPDYAGPQFFAVSLSDGAANNGIWLYSNIGAAFTFRIRDGGVDQVNFLGTTNPRDNAAHTIHERWSATNNALFIDLTSEGSPDTNATIPTTTTLYLGNYIGSITAPMHIGPIQVRQGQTLK